MRPLWVTTLKERIDQIVWVPEYLDDLEADFLRFYGIYDIYDMEGPRFFKSAVRLLAYGGVMTARAQYESEKASGKANPTPNLKAGRKYAKQGQEVRHKPLAAMKLNHSDLFD